jgi:hypothetical protein
VSGRRAAVTARKSYPCTSKQISPASARARYGFLSAWLTSIFSGADVHQDHSHSNPKSISLQDLSFRPLGTTLAYGTLGACIGFLVIGITIWLKVRGEEVILMKHFSEEYLSYKKRTRSLIPFVW